MSDDPVITVNDVMAAGHCPFGLRAWLKTHKIDARRFFEGQVRASEILATGDANGLNVVNSKLERMRASGDGR